MEVAGISLDQITGWGLIAGGFGYLAGAFVSSRRKGISESLRTALDEIDAERQRGDRLEREMHRQAEELAQVKAENATLRNLLTGGQPMIDAFDRKTRELEELTRVEHERTRALIEEIRKDTHG